MDSAGKLLLLLSCLGASAQFCEIPPADSNLVVRVTQQLLRWMDRQSPLELNPSIYVGLRLSNQPSQEQDDLYLNSLMIHYQQSFSSLAMEHQPSMGQLALYLLTVRGGCRNINTKKGRMLVTKLKFMLEEEKHRIGHNHEGYPLTSYYQYSLSILALCIHNKKVPGHVVEKLLYAAEHNLFLHGTQFSMDTAAMASLTFSCLKDSDLNPGLASQISSASEHLRNRILEEKTSEGYFGNIYNSPLALQALMATPSPKSRQACLQVGGALLKDLQAGAFQNPIPLSQLLPVLHHKTYLDLKHLDCNDERVLGPLEEDDLTPQTQELRNIRVSLKVQGESQNEFLHEGQYVVPEETTLQNVLIKAQEEDNFKFGTQTTLSGPFITSVMDIIPRERQYWQLLRAPDTPLQQGITDYKPQDGETILLRLASW